MSASKLTFTPPRHAPQVFHQHMPSLKKEGKRVIVLLTHLVSPRSTSSLHFAFGQHALDCSTHFLVFTAITATLARCTASRNVLLRSSAPFAAGRGHQQRAIRTERLDGQQDEDLLQKGGERGRYLRK